MPPNGVPQPYEVGGRRPLGSHEGSDELNRPESLLRRLQDQLGGAAPRAHLETLCPNVEGAVTAPREGVDLDEGPRSDRPVGNDLIRFGCNDVS